MAEKVIQCGRCETPYDGKTFKVGDKCTSLGQFNDSDDEECEGLLVEIVDPEEPKAKRKTNPMRWLAKEPESDGCMYIGPEFTSQPKADAWLEEHAKPNINHDLVRITVRDAFVEETVQRKLVYGNGS